MGRLHCLGSRIGKLDQRVALPAPKETLPFYQSPEWRSLMASILKERGRQCQHCGRTHNRDGTPIRIFGDHRTELSDGGAPLDRANIDLLCGACHTVKTNKARRARQSGAVV